MYINQLAKTRDRRIYDKRNSCFFCGKEFSKLARHLQQVHKQEPEVQKALQYKPNDPRRKEQFAKLCRMGNYNHNMSVREQKQGELKVARRPSSSRPVNPSDYLPCKFCCRFFSEADLARHGKTCQENNSAENTSKKQMRYDAILLLSGNEFPSGASQELSDHVLSMMALDDVTALVKADQTILLVGSRLIDKRGKRKAAEVSQQMRILGRMVKEARKLCGNAALKLSHLIKPMHFDTLVTCAKILGGCEQETNEHGKKMFSSPSTALKCGYSLKRASQVLRGQALRNQDVDAKKQIDMFLELYDSERTDKLSSHALGDLSFKKHNKPRLIPVTEDLMKLREHLVKEISRLTEIVKSDANPENWRELAEVTLARLTIFNKRRGTFVLS